MKTRQFYPDAESVSSVPSGPQKPRRTAGLPAKDADMMDTAKKVAESWLNEPQISLIWIKPSEFQSLVGSYAAELSERLSTGSHRPSQTNELRRLDQLCEAAVAEVKIYIRKKFKKDNAAAELARYGILKIGRGRRLPDDRNKKIEALKLMIAAIEKDGFNDEEFGKDFWLKTQSDYLEAFQTANTTDGRVSAQVAGKNSKKAQIKQAMKGLRLVITANYPDTYKAEFRKWGWQKEDY